MIVTLTSGEATYAEMVVFIFILLIPLSHPCNVHVPHKTYTGSSHPGRQDKYH